MAAVLACGDGALLSHRDGAALWGVLPNGGTGIDVTVPGRSRRGQRGINVHRVRTLHPEDRAVVDGIPVTSVARILLDLAEAVNLRRLTRAFETSERLRLLDMRAVDRLIERSPGRHGVTPLCTVIAEHRGVPDTRSELEQRFVEFCRDADIPVPALNVSVEGFDVDGVWFDARLIVELDSYGFHRSRAAFENDRARDAALQLARYRVIRVTDRRLTEDPVGLTRTIRRLRAQGLESGAVVTQRQPPR
jgi:hypothetical protein